MEDSIRESGKTIKWKEKEYLPGLTIEDMRETTTTIKRKDTEYFIGQMEESTRENGRMESNTE
jgi:hypothetical protein